MANFRETVRLLAGAAAIYGVVAACSAAGSAQRSYIAAPGGAQGAGGTDGAAGNAQQDSAVDAIIDALSEPVPDAKANDGGGAQTVTAQCTLKVKYGTGFLYYAEASFPGKTVAELYPLRAVVEYSSTLPTDPPGYNVRRHGQPWLADGKAAVYCGTDTDIGNVKDVVFRLP